MALDIKKYLETLAQESALDDATKAAVLKAAENEKFGKKLSEELLTRQDYSRSMDELAKQRAEAQKIQEWYAKAFPEYTEAVAAKAKFDSERPALEQKAKLADIYAQTYGPLDPSVTPAPTASPTNGNGGITLESVQKELEKLRGSVLDQSAGFIAEGVPLAIEHFKKTGEVLDFRQLLDQAKKLQQEPISPLRMAYQRLSSDVDSKLATEAQTKRDEQLKADAIKDYLSKNNIPIDTKPREASVFKSTMAIDPATVPKESTQQDAARMSAFMEAFNSPEATAARDRP